MIVSKTEKAILYPLLAVLLVVFSFYDLTITQYLCKDTGNTLGRVMENLAEVPFQFGCVLAAGLAFRFRPKDTKAKSILFGILFGFCFVALSVYGGGMIYSYVKNLTGNGYYWLGALIAIFYGVTGGLLAHTLPVDNPKRAFIYGCFVIILYLVILGVMNLLKLLWYRPRWRYLLATYGSDAASFFVPWYRPQCSGKFSDNFASFPSGHTMNAIAALIWILLPAFSPVLRGKKLRLRIIIYLWAVLCAVSRIAVGAHFASDVTMGYLLGFALFNLGTHCYVGVVKKVELTKKTA
jgi:membrane-associated phospholipid phosphatase